MSNTTKKHILSGITPSGAGDLHLGNYLGAIKSHVDFQTQGQCFYFVADYHALNTVNSAEQFSHNVKNVYLEYLSLGIDPEKTIFFVESHVPAIFELTEILKNVVTVSEMRRMHAFKDKMNDPDFDPDQINLGLFSYAVLMAADILVFDTDIVPVGEDQAQHVEVCRDIAQRFNHRYGNVLKVPELFIKKDVARVIGTDGERKMSKSLGNTLSIFADEATIKQQVMGITTDPGRIRKDDPGDPAKNVIFSYMRLMDFDEIKRAELEDRYRDGSVGDVEVKKVFLEFYLDYFSTFRARRAELAQDEDKLLALMKQNAVRANAVAEQVIARVRKGIGAVI